MKKIPFEPMEGFCLCEAPGHETSEGGIVVPEATIGADDKSPIKLKVVAVGPGEQLDGNTRREVVVEPWHSYYFLFPAYSLGATLTFGGIKYVVVQSKFVCGKVVA